MNAMIRLGLVWATVICVSLPSSAWAISQGASCRMGGHASSRAGQATLVCGFSQDPWQDCNEDPWQLGSSVSSPDTFADPWQDSADPWQPFAADSIAKLPTRLRPAAAEDPWQTMQVRVVRVSRGIAVRDSAEDPWQPTFSDPWQDDVEDPWQ